MASRILGMGDVLSLIEKAQDSADQKEAEETARRMMENKFDMNDMLSQLAQVRKMGGASAMLGMLPGGAKVDPSQVDEKVFDQVDAIIRSMTPRERRNPGILNASRRKRIAAGSGTTVQDVNALIRQFDQAKDMMKKMMGNKMMRKGKRRFSF